MEDNLPITEICLGNKKSKNIIYIYVSPSCLHCGKFIVEEVEEFAKKNGENCKIIIKLIPASARDVFIMKLIENEAKDESGYFIIFKNYIKRVLATINYIKPTEEQISKFKGSKTDEEMIKFQVEASDFGFSDEKILNAIPKMKEPFEVSIMENYKKSVRFISETLKTKELDLPLIVKNDKKYKNLNDVIKTN